MTQLHEHKKTLLALLVVACLAVAGAIAVTAGAETTSATDPNAAAPESSEVAPDWVQSQANEVIRQYTDTQAAESGAISAEWTKTTWGHYQAAVDGQGDPGSTREAYVVVVRGTFLEAIPPLAAKDATPVIVKGTVLVLAFDAETQDLSVVGLLYSESGLTRSALGETNPMSLTE